ncbi:MAG: SPOR domain-containing protein [Alphaproteobacteria bacterium]
MVDNNRRFLDPEDINNEEDEATSSAQSSSPKALKPAPLKVNPILQSNPQASQQKDAQKLDEPHFIEEETPQKEQPAPLIQEPITAQTQQPQLESGWMKNIANRHKQNPSQNEAKYEPSFDEDTSRKEEESVYMLHEQTPPKPEQTHFENEWMKNVADRRKQKLMEKEAPKIPPRKPKIELNLDEPKVDIEKPILAIEEEIETQLLVEEKKSSHLWLWMLLMALIVIVASVIALRFFGGNSKAQGNYDKPVISAEPQWKVRPEDRGGADVPFEDLKILDTTGNARLLQNHVDLLLPTGQAQAQNEQKIDMTEHDLQQEVASLLAASAPSEDALNSNDIEAESSQTTATPSREKIVSQPSEIPVSSEGISAWQVQMSSVFSEKDAKAEWQRFSRRYGNIVTDQPALIVQAGNAFALRIGSFQSSRDAQSLCEHIKTAGGDCLIISPR